MTDTPPRQARRSLPLVSLVLSLLFAALMTAGAWIQPPPVRANNEDGQFDAIAAKAGLERIIGAGAPHPIDSDAQDEVRARLLREIAALGIEPEVRERFACRPLTRGMECALARNIVFSIGPQTGPAVLVASHYDSVPAGPGASDDGVGVAASLEIARLLAGDRLARRVIFLISDGEEQALLGAYDFAANDPLMSDVAALVNLEARGTRGPAMFFETNQPNGAAVAAFTGAPRPVANSVMADVYALMPNSTDVTVLTREGLDVINLALLDGFENYHTPQDSLASFNGASLQHMGDVALHAVRGFARGEAGGAERMVYTDVASTVLLAAPLWAAQASLAVSVLIALVAFWRSGAERRWRTLAIPPLAFAAAASLAWLIGAALAAMRPGVDYWYAHPEFTRAWCALAGLLGVVFALWLLRAPRAGAGAAGFAWFALTGLVASFYLGGASILFAAPASVFALGIAVSWVWKPALRIGAIAGAVLALLILAPMFAMLELALGYAMPAAFAAVVALLGWTWLDVLVAPRWRGAALVLTAALIVAVGAAALAPSASTARPLPLNVTYFADVTANEARVLVGSATRAVPQELAADFEFSAERVLPGDRYPSWTTPAERQPVPAPTLQDVAVSAGADGTRIVRARLAMNGAYRATLRLPRQAGAQSATLNGAGAAFAETGGEYVNIACQGRGCDGASVDIVLAGSGEGGDWFVIGQTPGLHPAAGAVNAARPRASTPIQFGDATLTLERLPAPR